MHFQECALYGDLVLWLRDQAAGLLAGNHGNLQQEKERLDQLIRDWFFTPQEDLHGCAPRDLILAEQAGKPNPIDPACIGEFFFDDCPICQMECEEIRQALEAGEDTGFHWNYDDGGYPLIARYDPKGWDALWAEEDAKWPAQDGTPGVDELPDDIPF